MRGGWGRSFSRAYRACGAGWDDGYGGGTGAFVGGCHLDGVLVPFGRGFVLGLNRTMRYSSSTPRTSCPSSR